jgi:mycoredoxin
MTPAMDTGCAHGEGSTARPGCTRVTIVDTDTRERMRMSDRLTIYTTTHCGPCRRLKKQLNDEQIGYSEVNVEHDVEAAEWLMNVNGGNRTVPTVKFDDGSTLTNPSLAAVKARLALGGTSAPH